MPSGYTVSGRGDLDALFAARTTTKRADIGFKVAAVDISNRYETIGASVPIGATGFQSVGTDLASLFKGFSTITEEVMTITPSANAAPSGGYFNFLGVAKYGEYGLGYSVSAGSPFPNGFVLRRWVMATESTSAPNQFLEVVIEGFASEPGATWLQWARSAGVEKAGGAGTYEWFPAASPKAARWYWRLQSNNWGFVAGTPISVRIGHGAP